MKAYPVETHMRGAKVLPLGAGTSDVQTLIIANSL